MYVKYFGNRLNRDAFKQFELINSGKLRLNRQYQERKLIELAEQQKREAKGGFDLEDC